MAFAPVFTLGVLLLTGPLGCGGSSDCALDCPGGAVCAMLEGGAQVCLSLEQTAEDPRSCAEILGCAAMVSTQVELDACAAQGDPGAQQDFEQLLRCLEAHQCEDTTCIEACDTELERCQGGAPVTPPSSPSSPSSPPSAPSGPSSPSTPAPSGPGGTSGPTPPGAGLSCAQILDCASDCPDSACSAACVDGGTSEALSRLEALLQCLEQSGCDGDCATVCEAPLSRCEADR